MFVWVKWYSCFDGFLFVGSRLFERAEPRVLHGASCTRTLQFSARMQQFGCAKVCCPLENGEVGLEMQPASFWPGVSDQMSVLHGQVEGQFSGRRSRSRGPTNAPLSGALGENFEIRKSSLLRLPAAIAPPTLDCCTR